MFVENESKKRIEPARWVWTAIGLAATCLLSPVSSAQGQGPQLEESVEQSQQPLRRRRVPVKPLRMRIPDGSVREFIHLKFNEGMSVRIRRESSPV